MGLDLGTLKGSVELDIAKFEQKYRLVIQLMEKLSRQKLPELFVDADTTRADKKVELLRNLLQQVAKTDVSAHVDADTAKAEQELDAVRDSLVGISKTEAEARVDAEIQDAQADLAKIEADLHALGQVDATAQVTADIAQATGDLATVEAKLRGLAGLRAELVVIADTSDAEDALSDLADEAADAGEKGGDSGGKNLVAGIVGALATIPIVGAIAGVAKSVADAVSEAFQEGLAIEANSDRFQASTGLDEATSAKFGRAAGEAYANNFGESIEGNMDAAKIALRTSLIDPTSTKKDAQVVIESLTGVADLLGEEVPAVARAAGQAIHTGIAKDAAGAFDLLVKAEQNGINNSEDLLDTVNEYGTQFRKLGLEGPQAFGLIAQAVKGGARDTDLAADALKEFSIRAIDGSESSAVAFKALGLSASEMTAQIAAGGPQAAEGLGLVLERLRGIEDPAERAQVAVGLFGTQAEDLGDALYTMDLGTAVQQFGQVEGAAQKAFAVMGDNSAAQIETAKRNIEVAATGVKGALAQMAAPALEKLSSTIANNREKVVTFLFAIADGAVNVGRTFVNGFAGAIEAAGKLVSALAPVLDAAVDAYVVMDKLTPGDQGSKAVRKWADGVVDSMSTADESFTKTADTIRGKLITNGLDPLQTKLGEVSKTQIADAAMHDSAARLASSIEQIGVAADGSAMAVKVMNGAFDTTTAAGKELDGQIKGVVAALDDQLKSAVAAGEGQRTLVDTVIGAREAFIQQATAMGITADEAAKLADKYGLVPSKVDTLISADDAQARATLDTWLDTAGSASATMTIEADDTSATSTLEGVTAQINDADGTVTILGNDGQAKATLTNYKSSVDTASGTVTITGNDAQGRTITTQMVGWANQQRATIAVAANTTQARADLLSVRDLAAKLTLTVQARVAAGGATGPLKPGFANGGVVEYYAKGGVRENHIAQVAPAGAWRTWAEPETGGEAYIPLAPGKRKRSEDILADVAKRFGGEYVTQAGGTTQGVARHLQSLLGAGMAQVTRVTALSAQSMASAAGAVGALAGQVRAREDEMTGQMTELYGYVTGLAGGITTATGDYLTSLDAMGQRAREATAGVGTFADQIGSYADEISTHFDDLSGQVAIVADTVGQSVAAISARVGQVEGDVARAVEMAQAAQAAAQEAQAARAAAAAPVVAPKPAPAPAAPKPAAAAAPKPAPVAPKPAPVAPKPAPAPAAPKVVKKGTYSATKDGIIGNDGHVVPWGNLWSYFPKVSGLTFDGNFIPWKDLKGYFGFAAGGLIPGTPPGDKRIDNLLAVTGQGTPIAVQSGEYIEPHAAVAHYGIDVMNAIRDRRIPREALAAVPGLAAGGPVGRVGAQPLRAGGPMVGAGITGHMAELYGYVTDLSLGITDATGAYLRSLDTMSQRAREATSGIAVFADQIGNYEAESSAAFDELSTHVETIAGTVGQSISAMGDRVAQVEAAVARAVEMAQAARAAVQVAQAAPAATAAAPVAPKPAAAPAAAAAAPKQSIGTPWSIGPSIGTPWTAPKPAPAPAPPKVVKKGTYSATKDGIIGNDGHVVPWGNLWSYFPKVSGLTFDGNFIPWKDLKKYFGFAAGGKIPGTPPSDPREDNLLAVTGQGTPIAVRSGEYIQPQPTVEYYGEAVMEALRTRSIPREALTSHKGLAAGGPVGRVGAQPLRAGGPMVGAGITGHMAELYGYVTDLSLGITDATSAYLRSLDTMSQRAREATSGIAVFADQISTYESQFSAAFDDISAQLESVAGTVGQSVATLGDRVGQVEAAVAKAMEMAQAAQAAPAAAAVAPVAPKPAAPTAAAAAPKQSIGTPWSIGPSIGTPWSIGPSIGTPWTAPKPAPAPPKVVKKGTYSATKDGIIGNDGHVVPWGNLWSYFPKVSGLTFDGNFIPWKDLKGYFGFAAGGLIPGTPPGDKRIDNLLAVTGQGVPIGVQSGEYIEPHAAVAHYGIDVMNAIRDRRIPREALAAVPGLAAGGPVGRVGQPSRVGGPMVGAGITGHMAELYGYVTDLSVGITDATSAYLRSLDTMSQRAREATSGIAVFADQIGTYEEQFSAAFDDISAQLESVAGTVGQSVATLGDRVGQVEAAVAKAMEMAQAAQAAPAATAVAPVAPKPAAPAAAAAAAPKQSIGTPWSIGPSIGTPWSIGPSIGTPWTAPKPAPAPKVVKKGTYSATKDGIIGNDGHVVPWGNLWSYFPKVSGLTFDGNFIPWKDLKGYFGFAAGGLIPGTPPGDKRIDNLLAVTGQGVPIGVQSGEYIEPHAAVAHYGIDVMNAIRDRRIPREALAAVPGLAAGGPVAGYLPTPATTSGPRAGTSTITRNERHTTVKTGDIIARGMDPAAVRAELKWLERTAPL